MVDRLAQLSRKIKIFAVKGPAYHYTYGQWRLRRWLAQERVETADFTDQTLFDQLNPGHPGLSQVAQAVVEKNYADGGAKLSAYFQTRVTPHFFFEPGDIVRTISLIPDPQKEATVHHADEICQNSFCFRRVGPIKFEDSIDWTYRPQGNIDWTWDLNRHAYFETLGRAYWYTGDERYAQKFRALLFDWLANNPAGVRQPNWSSVFEVAFRVNTWLWAFYYFRAAAAFDSETCLTLLKGLLAHGRYLDANLELHAQNNHLLLEAKSLALLGLAFPEFKQAQRWRQRGLKIFYEQIRAQVCPDGVHGERATFYHRVIAGELLELLVWLKNNQIPIPVDIEQIFSKMVEFELWITKPDGLIPLWSDSAFEDTYPRFNAASGGPAFLDRNEFRTVAPPPDEGSLWLLGHKRVKPFLNPPVAASCLKSRAFPEGGYFVMRQNQNSEATYLAFDGGPFGYKPVPGHGHADALSFEVYAYGQTHLVDSGVYGTRLGDNWRNFFRSSRAHNTVVVDDQDQSLLVGTWQVDRPAQTTLHQWFSSDYFDFVDASHNGYERIAEPITHRRQIFFAKPEYWVVSDWLTGQGKHCFDLYFHAMPGKEAQLEPASGSAYFGNEGEPGLHIIPLTGSDLTADVITGATAPIQGWVSFFSGEKQAAPTLRYRLTGTAPVQFCTLLYPYPAGRIASVEVSPLDVKVPGFSEGSGLTSLQIETETYLDYLVIDGESTKRLKVFAGYETDAQLVYLRCQKKNDDLVKVIVRGESQFRRHGRQILKADADASGFIFDSEYEI